MGIQGRQQSLVRYGRLCKRRRSAPRSDMQWQPNCARVAVRRTPPALLYRPQIYELLYRGKGNITQPSTNATPRKVRKTVAPYWSRSCGDSFEVSEKTMETQNAKIVRAVKCDSSMRLFLSAY
jgi:hypothetical protein